MQIEKTATHIATMCHMGYPYVHIVTPPADNPQMGGHWFLWNETQIKVELKMSNDMLAHFDITLLERTQPMAYVTSIYNYAQYNRHDEVWNDLNSLSLSISHPCF